MSFMLLKIAFCWSLKNYWWSCLEYMSYHPPIPLGLGEILISGHFKWKKSGTMFLFTSLTQFLFNVSVCKEQNAALHASTHSRLNRCPKGYHYNLILKESFNLFSKYVFNFSLNSTAEKRKFNIIIHYITTTTQPLTPPRSQNPCLNCHEFTIWEGSFMITLNMQSLRVGVSRGKDFFLNYIYNYNTCIWPFLSTMQYVTDEYQLQKDTWVTHIT